jgi:hypothetical protein
MILVESLRGSTVSAGAIWQKTFERGKGKRDKLGNMEEELGRIIKMKSNKVKCKNKRGKHWQNRLGGSKHRLSS